MKLIGTTNVDDVTAEIYYYPSLTKDWDYSRFIRIKFQVIVQEKETAVCIQ